jgi:GAF domain-containing protein
MDGARSISGMHGRGWKMETNSIRHNHLVAELLHIFDLQSNINAVLATAMYKLSKLLNCERSSIFIVDVTKAQLYSFSSLDLDMGEIKISTSSGVSGWVFRHCQPAIVEDAYDDSRFDISVDRVTRFHTRNLICAPLTGIRGSCCLGTIQSLNKKSGSFIGDDLELLRQAAYMVVVAIENNRSFGEVKTANLMKGKVIKHLVNQIKALSRQVCHLAPIGRFRPSPGL